MPLDLFSLVCFSTQSNNCNVIPGAACRVEDIINQSPLNTRQEAVSAASYGSLLVKEAETNLLPPQSAANTSSDEYTFTELQPVNFQPSSSAFSTSYSPFISQVPSTTVNTCSNIPNANVPTSIPSTSIADQYSDVTWLTTTNQHHVENDADDPEEEEDELFFEGDEENDDDFEMRSEIQWCLSLNRDYQVTPHAILIKLTLINLCKAISINQVHVM